MKMVQRKGGDERTERSIAYMNREYRTENRTERESI